MVKSTKQHTPLLVPRARLADLLSVNARTIDKFMVDGLPVAVPGKPGKAAQFDVKACVAWLIERAKASMIGEGGDLSPNQERALLDRRRREDLDLKLAERRGELVEIATVARDFAEVANTTKSRLRRIPDAVADRLVGVAAGGPLPVRALLLAEIDEALRELAERAAPAEGTAA